MSSTELVEQTALEGVNPAASPDAEGVTTGASPTSEESAEKLTTYDVVRKALGSDTEGSPTSEGGEVEAEAETEQPEEETPEQEALEPEDLTSADRKALSVKAERRFRYLNETNKRLSGQIAELQPKVEGFEKLSGFVRQNNLDAQEIDNALGLLAQLKNDPVNGFKVLESIYQEYAAKVGAVMPPDLADKVRLGYISEADAQELARARAGQQLTQAQLQAQQDRARQEAEEQRFKQMQTTAVSAAEKWRASKAKNDPDWNLKQQRVADVTKLKLLETGKYPQTEREVVALCDEALKQVEQELAAFRPQPKAVKPLVTGAAPTRTVSEPKNTLEVIQRTLAGGT